MQIRIRSTGQVLLQHEWEKWVAQTYAKSISGITPEIINTFDSDPVFEGPQATGGTVYQYSQQDGYEQVDGKWYTKFVLGPIFTDTEEATAVEQETAYKAGKDAEQATSVRKQRAEKLSETDWTQLTDAPVNSALWATYRQALRDVPTQEGFPWEVTWPTQPE